MASICEVWELPRSSPLAGALEMVMTMHRECRDREGQVGHLWQWGFATLLCMVLRCPDSLPLVKEEILCTLLSATAGLGQVLAFATNLKAVRDWETHKTKNRVLLRVCLPESLRSVWNALSNYLTRVQGGQCLPDMPVGIKQYAPTLDVMASKRAVAFFLTYFFCPAYNSGYVGYMLSQADDQFQVWLAQMVQIPVLATGPHRVI